MSKLPKLFSVRLRTSVFYFDLTWIDSFEERFVSVCFGNFDFLTGDLIKESRHDFPAQPNSSRCVSTNHLEQSSTVVLRQSLTGFLESRDRHIADAHSSKIINDDPVLNLTWNEHVLDDLLVHEASCQESCFYIVEVDHSRVEYQNWSEKSISTTWIEISLSLSYK